ncbi:MAG: PHP domain-containing protein, partial [Treponema sp.]|nr:PHP domain-containing protein [Treponema sp.]
MAEIRVFPTPNIPVSTFVHLHVHSDYSLKTGSSSLYSLVAKAKSLNMKALALTDTNNLIGAVNFEKICRANGINPVIGEDIVVCDEEDFFNLVLLCKDLTGYKNLCKLSGITYSKKFTARKHFVPIEDLKDYSEGLICLSGGKK